MFYNAYHARIHYHNDSTVEFRRSNRECAGLTKEQLDAECRAVAKIVGDHIGSDVSMISFLKFLPEITACESK